MRTRQEVIEELSKAITRRKEAEEDIDNLRAELKEIDKIPPFPVFELGDGFCYLGIALGVTHGAIINPGNTHWNMFHTQEYAKEFSKRVELLAKLFHCKWYLDIGYNPDWKTGERKFFVTRLDGKFSVDTVACSDSGTVYFSTREKAERAAAWMNEHALEEMEERK